jgi:hypothetical protein
LAERDFLCRSLEYHILRIALFRSALIADLTRGVTFLTTLAGASVLGVQFVILTPFIALAAGLWVFAVLLWIILIYTFFAAVTIAEPKPSIDVAINGSWLLVTVSTESLSVLGTLVAQTLGAVPPILFEALCAYLLGAMFYILFIALIVYRWIFLRMEPAKLSPPILDQYGRTSDYYVGRGTTDTQLQKLGCSARSSAFYHRLYTVFLGDRNLVDSTFSHCWFLEACGPARTAHLRPAILIARFSVGDVHCRDV